MLRISQFGFLDKYRRVLLVLVFLALLLAAVEWSGVRQNFNLPYLRHALSENRLQGLLIFVVLFTLGNLVQVPGWIFLAAAVIVLGKVYGGLATYFAANISCAITFLGVRFIGGDAVRQLNGKFLKRIITRLHAHPIRNVILLRTVFQTLAALNYTLALSGLEFRKYMVGTLLGLPLPIAAYCVFFDFIASLARLSEI